MPIAKPRRCGPRATPIWSRSTPSASRRTTTRRPRLKQAAAEVAAARAAVDKAGIDLEFTRVSAPISGRIGRSTVTAGALVTANQATALATIQQLDPIYVDLTQSSTELLRLRRDLEAGRLQRLRDATVPVRLVLEDGSVYSGEGKLAFSEVSVDPGTGSVTLRAVFPEPARRAAAGDVRARAADPGRAEGRHRRAARGGEPQIRAARRS